MRLSVLSITFALVILAFTSHSPLVNPLTSYKQGPIIPLSAGHKLTIQYDSSISDQEVQTGNSILDNYIPKLLDLFWNPADDLTITLHKSKTGCGPDGIACEAFTDVYIGGNYWIYPSVWVHEFTHILQYTFFDAPGHAVRDEALLFYIEPTAIAAQTILAPANQQWWPDRSFLTPDYGVTEAIYNYNNYQSGDAHARTTVWVSLYQADHDIFKEVNARLVDLSQQRKIISNATDLRTIISEAAQIKLLDGLPLDQWLAVEGLLAKSEVGNKTLAHVIYASYTNFEGQLWVFSAYIQAGSVTEIELLDTLRSWVKLYDAATRGFMVVSSEFERVPGSPFWIYDRIVIFNQLGAPVAQVIRADFHLVGSGFVEDRHMLLPLYSNVTDVGTNVILFSTADGWLEQVNGNAQVGEQSYQITNGVLKFNLDRMVDVKLSVGPQPLVRNFVPSGKVMVLGINYTAVDIVPTKIPSNILSQTSSFAGNETSGNALVTVLAVIAVPVIMIALAASRRILGQGKKRLRLRKRVLP